MVGFRVLVNLGNYFSDYRQKSWIYVDRKRLKTITDLKTHICEVFAIGGGFEIFIYDNYVPSSESLSIINEGDILELKTSVGASLTTEDVSVLEERKEEELIPEKKKRSKKRKGNDVEVVDDNIQALDAITVDPLPENFHPEYNSTMTAQKKRKKSQNMVLTEISMEISMPDDSKSRKKKSKQRMENSRIAEETVTSSINCSQKEGSLTTYNITASDEVDKIRSKVISFPFFKEALETKLRDLNTQSESLDVSETNVLSSEQSAIENSLLEHTIYERVVDDIKGESEKSNMSTKKKKRKRPKKKKPKNIPSNSHPPFDNNVNISKSISFPCSQPIPAVKLNSKTHLRFSDSEEDDKLCKTSSPASEAIKGDVESGVIPSESSSVNAVSKNVGVTNEEIQTFTTHANGLVKEEVCSNEAASKQSNPKSQKSDADSVMVVQHTNEKVNGQCAKDKKEPRASPSAQISNLFSKDSVKRMRKAVINTGLGATLAHLMKDNKTPQESISNTNLCPSESIISLPVQLQPVFSEKQTLKSKKFYNEFPVVEKYPREGDILAFKILKMNENYEPCISNFMEGAVTECDQNQSTVTIKILEGANELDRGNGKFDLQLEEEEVKNGSEDVVLVMEWKDVIEPRLVFP